MLPVHITDTHTRGIALNRRQDGITARFEAGAAKGIDQLQRAFDPAQAQVPRVFKMRHTDGRNLAKGGFINGKECSDFQNGFRETFQGRACRIRFDEVRSEGKLLVSMLRGWEMLPKPTSIMPAR